MISVNEAANIAAEYMKGFFPNTDFIQLEEVEITDDKLYWFITLSYNEESAIRNVFQLNTPTVLRKYKQFKIDSESGEVLAMKIRDIK
ncbi:hypothetical protein [Adhaeribacter pallidiroseus]|uniref:PepSY domain-containing protein n=1 Tax=Adhaeribacter pallidiroseus TaxID=2072847 RepID=A0A369QJJ4_9BACT|nr:hypothetical protein [Adhaeribacter pallidiroseus]RDC65081.1 hypothetical protein AHMF7616_03704 [Adhaeribacter pallidiroseus]